MKILLILDYLPPLQKAATKRCLGIITFLLDNGHDVVILSANNFTLPFHSNRCSIICPKSSKKSIFSPKKLASSIDQPFDFSHSSPSSVKSHVRNFILVFKRFIFRSFGFLSEPLNFRIPWLLYKAFTKLNKNNVDIVISSYSPFYTLVIGYFVSKFFRIPWIADFRDLFAFNPSINKYKPISFLELLVERLLLHQSSVITTVSSPLCQLLSARHKRKVVEIMNGYNFTDVKLFETVSQDLLPASFSQSSFNIVHTGTLIDGSRDPTPFLSYFEKNKTELTDLCFKITGKKSINFHFVGSRSSTLEKYLTNHQLNTTVHIHGVVPRDQSICFQKFADCLLLVETDSSRDLGNITSKIFEYLLSGRPIIGLSVPVQSQLADIIIQSESGVLAENIPKSMHSALVKSFANSQRTTTASSNWLFNNQLNKLSAIIADLI